MRQRLTLDRAVPLARLMNNWMRYRPAIWLVILGLALALVLNLIAGAAFIGAGLGVGVMISRGARPRRWLK
jgi:hypothetical protein